MQLLVVINKIKRVFTNDADPVYLWWVEFECALDAGVDARQTDACIPLEALRPAVHHWDERRLVYGVAIIDQQTELREHTEPPPHGHQHLITDTLNVILELLYFVYTGMFPVGDTSCRTLIAVCVCVCLSADISLNCAKIDERILLKFCGYVGCHYATNVSNCGYEPIKFSSLKLIK